MDNEKWVYVHIEFETAPTNEIGERMFSYYRHIREKYGKEITAIVVYTGSKIPKQFDRYEYNSFGTQISYVFNTFKVIEQNEVDLIKNKAQL